MTNTAYEPSRDFCSKISGNWRRQAVRPAHIGADITQHIQPNTKNRFSGIPGSITMEST